MDMFPKIMCVVFVVLIIFGEDVTAKKFKGKKSWFQKYGCSKSVTEKTDGFSKYNEYSVGCTLGKISPNNFTYVDKCKNCWDPAINREIEGDEYQPLAITTEMTFKPTDVGTRNETYKIIKACTCEKKGGRGKKSSRGKGGRKRKH